MAALAMGAVVIVLCASAWQLWVRKAPGSAAEAAPPGPSAALAPLKGRWQRLDGGYLLDILDVGATGELRASYSNPRPIHVAKARASVDGGAVRLFVELRDVNYPGSTYELTYDAAHDRLAGVYFQAVERQSFDVAFVRLSTRVF